MFCHIKKIEPRKVSPEIEERVLVSPENTSYKMLCVKVLTIEPGKETEVLQLGEERVFFILDGRGTLTAKWIKADWAYTIRSDMAIWIPSTIGCRIRNCGDAPLRYLVGACATESKVDERFTSIQVVDIHEVPSIPLVGGNMKILFAPETLKAMGSTRFNLCGYNSLSPEASLNPHVPTGRCEEIMYVTRGYGVMGVADEKRPVEPGSLVYVPVDTPHAVQNTGKDALDFFVLESQK